MQTFEVSLKDYLRANPDNYNTSHTVIIREEWGRSYHIHNWKICDGSYHDRDNEKIITSKSDVCGIDLAGEERSGMIMCATILLPLNYIYESHNRM